MKLDLAFRKTIETVGLENYSSKRFSNTLRDHYYLESSELFIWNSLINTDLINDLLSINNQQTEILEFINKISYRTGFNIEILKSLLIPFWRGCIMAFYGIFPPETVELTIQQTYYNNFMKWREREKLLENGIVMVKRDSLYGWYDLNGNEIIPCKFIGASQFNDGLACVHSESIWGFINFMGNLEIDLNSMIFDRNEIRGITNFHNGIAIVYSKGSTRYPIPPYIVEPNNPNNKDYSKKDRIGFLSKNGKYTGCVYEQYPYRQDWGLNYFIIKRNDLYGLMDYDCNVVIEPQFVAIEELNNSGESTCAKNEDGNWVIIDSKGNISKCSSNSLKKISESIFIGVSIKTKLRSDGYTYNFPDYSYSLYDEYGKTIEGKLKIIDYYAYRRTPILVLSNSTKRYFIDNKGIIGNVDGYENAFPFYNDYTWVKTCGKWTRINSLGEEIISTTDFDIISEEINGKVLIRDYSTGNISVLDCIQRKVVRTITHSSDVSPKRVIDLSKNIWYYTISQREDKPQYLWINGNLFKYDSIIKVISTRGHVVIGQKDNNSFDLIFDGQYAGTFSKRDNNDVLSRISKCRKSVNNTYTLQIKRSEGGEYLVTINHKCVYISNIYKKCEILSPLPNNSSIVQSYDNTYILLNSELKEVFHAEKIEVTGSENFYTYYINGKIGLISESGNIVLPPEYDKIWVNKNY